jgi:hypothetical protein
MIDLPHSEESGREFKNIKDLRFEQRIGKVTQIRTIHGTPKLLLGGDPKHSFSLRYSELRLFKECVADLELFDSSAGRVITVTTSASHLYVSSRGFSQAVYFVLV